jgi:tryptophanyl-tRNA synthetase
MAKERILSGMRPSGKLHLGNYLGALKNWVQLQEDYECFYFVADWHALTTGYADTAQTRAWVREIAIDYLSAGLDPERSILFIQSRVPEHAELHLLLSMITPLGACLRKPQLSSRELPMVT